MLKSVGYFPKRSGVPQGWAEWTCWAGRAPSVSEVCSVSECFNRGPEGWIDRWLHNELGFFNTRTDALAVVPPRARDFSLFAYRLLCTRARDGRVEDFSVPDLPIEPLPDSFRSLGFDVVSKHAGAGFVFFECSPLSCNGMAAEVPVNSCCLIESLDAAVAVALRFSQEQPEPGDYYVVEVLREGPGADA
jgi:hypothetical protein